MGSVEQKSVIWKHFRFLHMPDVENSEITSHVGKSEIYPVCCQSILKKLKISCWQINFEFTAWASKAIGNDEKALCYVLM